MSKYLDTIHDAIGELDTQAYLIGELAWAMRIIGNDELHHRLKSIEANIKDSGKAILGAVGEEINGQYFRTMTETGNLVTKIIDGIVEEKI